MRSVSSGRMNCKGQTWKRLSTRHIGTEPENDGGGIARPGTLIQRGATLYLNSEIHNHPTVTAQERKKEKIYPKIENFEIPKECREAYEKEKVGVNFIKNYQKKRRRNFSFFFFNFLLLY